MRGLALDQDFAGILAWNSLFHLSPDDQRAMFAVFERHAGPGCALMFTSWQGAGQKKPVSAEQKPAFSGLWSAVVYRIQCFIMLWSGAFSARAWAWTLMVSFSPWAFSTIRVRGTVSPALIWPVSSMSIT